MPWDIRRNYGSCSGYAVVKESDGSIAGCHETREKAARQIAALEASEAGKTVSPEFEKYRGQLYAMLTPEEKAFHDALVSIAQQYGPFDQGTSSIWVGYESGEDNEDAEIGVMCSNCSFFNPENNGCAILSYQVEPMGKCRLAAIPDGMVKPEIEEEEEEGEEMEEMDKAAGVRVGQMVSWNSSGGRAMGRVKRIIRDGSYNVPDSDFTITGTPDNPAVVIEVYRDDKPTGRMVGHRMNTLRSVGKAENSLYVMENYIGCVGGYAVVDKSGAIYGCYKSLSEAKSRASMTKANAVWSDSAFSIKKS